MKVTRLRIVGMTCESCNANVRQALENVLKAQQVTLDAGSASAIITHEEVPPEVLTEAVHRSGYGAYTLRDDARNPLRPART